jgi:hypothetical protein
MHHMIERAQIYAEGGMALLLKRSADRRRVEAWGVGFDSALSGYSRR